MRKKNQKEHNTSVYGKNVHPKERHETSGEPKLNFGEKKAEVDDNEQNENIQKKIILQVDSQTDRRTDGQMVLQFDSQTDRRTDGQKRVREHQYIKVICLWYEISTKVVAQKIQVEPIFLAQGYK